MACVRIAATYGVFSQTVDEPIHVAAGHQWLREGRPVRRVGKSIRLYRIP